MSDKLSYAEVTLAGVFPAEIERLHVLTRTIAVEHFPPELQPFYRLLLTYFTLTGGVPAPKEWRELLTRNGVEPAVREGLEGIYKRLFTAEKVSDHGWKFAIEAMKIDRQTELFIEAQTETMRILTEGMSDDRGDRQYGYKSAYAFLAQRMGAIDALAATIDSLPEGNVMEEGERLWSDYQDRKTSKVHLGVQTGLETLDNVTFGAQPGEFWLLAAYAGHGKSQTLTNIAYQAVMDGQNVVYITLETLRDQVSRRFITRHTSNPKFGAHEGLQYNDIKSGHLIPEDEELLKRVLADIKSEDYGRFEVVWLPRGTNVNQIKMKLDILESLFRIDLVIVDYAGLMGAGRRVERRQEGLVEILQGLKGMATGHARGRGVPVLSAYQTSRQKLDDARSSGGYTLDSLAETAEAERSADLVLTLLRQHDEDTELHAQILKYRDGQKAEFYLETDFSRSFLTDRSGGVSDESDEFTGLFS